MKKLKKKKKRRVLDFREAFRRLAQKEQVLMNVGKEFIEKSKKE